MNVLFLQNTNFLNKEAKVLKCDMWSNELLDKNFKSSKNVVSIRNNLIKEKECDRKFALKKCHYAFS